MSSFSINVKVSGELRNHVERQTGPSGLYESVSEYIRDLIRQDRRRQEDGLAWLRAHLAPLVETPEDEFQAMSPDALIQHARKRFMRTDE